MSTALEPEPTRLPVEDLALVDLLHEMARAHQQDEYPSPAFNAAYSRALSLARLLSGEAGGPDADPPHVSERPCSLSSSSEASPASGRSRRCPTAGRYGPGRAAPAGWDRGHGAALSSWHGTGSRRRVSLVSGTGTGRASSGHLRRTGSGRARERRGARW